MNRLVGVAKQIGIVALYLWVPLLFALALVVWSFVPFGASNGTEQGASGAKTTSSSSRDGAKAPSRTESTVSRSLVSPP